MTTTVTNGKTRSRSATKKALVDLQATLSAQEPDDEKTARVKREHKSRIEQDVGELTFEKIAQEITKTELNISKALANVNSAVKEQVELLEKLREAEQLKREEIENLHGKEVVASAIDVLIAEYEEKRLAFEADVAQKRLEWENEKKQHADLIKERNDKVSREWAQAAQEYEYQLRLQRRGEEEEWDEHVTKRKRALTEYEETKKTEWKSRETALAGRESRISELERIEKSLSETIFAAKKEAEKEVTSLLIARHQNELKIQSLTHGNEIVSRDQQIAALTQQLNDAKKNVEVLRDENKNLQNQLQSMAIASLGASSGKEALAAVKDVVEKSNVTRK